MNELRRYLLGLSCIQRKNQRPTLRAVPACGFRFAKKVASAPFTVLGIQNLRPCGDPIGLVVTQSVPTGDEIAPARRCGMGSQSHWQFRDPKYIHPLSTARTKSGAFYPAIVQFRRAAACRATASIDTVYIRPPLGPNHGPLRAIRNVTLSQRSAKVHS